MNENDVIKLLKNNELTKEEIENILTGDINYINNKSNKAYLKIGIQILIENKIEFILNKLLNENIIGVKKKKYGLIEKEYYYLK